MISARLPRTLQKSFSSASTVRVAAFSINVRLGTPNRSVVKRSTSRISAAERIFTVAMIGEGYWCVKSRTQCQFEETDKPLIVAAFGPPICADQRSGSSVNLRSYGLS
jgi:hypothetical protein